MTASSSSSSGSSGAGAPPSRAGWMTPRILPTTPAAERWWSGRVGAAAPSSALHELPPWTTGGTCAMTGSERQPGHGGRKDDPSLSGMRLSELIAEVQERLTSVARVQARVQNLLDAFLSVSTGLDLPSTLRRLVENACDLVDARYGALGVLRQGGGGLASFIHVGIDDELAARMGHL